MKKCRYKYCKHDTKDIPDSEAVKDGNAYYHPDCHHEKETIKKIIDVYVEYVDQHPVFGHLRKTVDTIIHTNHVDADYVLFAVKKAVKEHRLNHVPGLYYAVKNSAAESEWRKQKASEALSNDDFVVTDTTKTYTYNQKKKKSIADLF